MSRKIIIITRTPDYYTKGDYILSKAIKKRGEEISNSFYSAFEKIVSAYKNEDGLKTAAFKEFANSKGIKLNVPTTNVIKKWININNDKSLIIPDVLVQLLEKIKNENNDVTLYDKVKYRDRDRDDEVYLFYYDKTQKKVDLWQMLALICKDCGINFQENAEAEKSGKHVLYIHDEQWGINSKNLVLMENSVPKDVANSDLLKKLSGQFCYVAAFMHETSAGGIFINILNCKFGKFLSDKMGNLEESTDVETFIELKKRMDSLIQTEMN